MLFVSLAEGATFNKGKINYKNFKKISLAIGKRDWLHRTKPPGTLDLYGCNRQLFRNYLLEDNRFEKFAQGTSKFIL